MLLSQEVVLPQLKPMCFNKIKLWWCPRKLAKFVRIFYKIEYTKSRGVTYRPERIGPVFPMLWSSYDFSYNFVTNVIATPIAWEILVQFFPVTIWPSGLWCVLSRKIFSRIQLISLGIIIWFYWKTLALDVATLPGRAWIWEAQK